ncbi:MAG: DNA gyrase subunit A [Mycoplasmatota bacterium]|nr:DNA gyrase subunit A [Mycoplasmatota bacterium]
MDNNDNKEKSLDSESQEILNDDELNYGGDFKERDSLTENNIVEEVKKSFLDYSMSVITSRALPDLRDGLKPVHRRILWSMYNSGYTPDKPHRKSAKTVGEVMGNYHPHGDSSIYEAMVRMAQDFNQRYMLIDGHGNFGNIEGDGAAAMRYTESRLSKISLELLRDINKDTVDFDPNFDETLKEPRVLPSRFPNILVNGTMGIAVGMATNIPPHNLGEVIDGCIAYIDNPDIDTMGLMQYIKGPDFPTGGIILGNSGIRKAYETGRGSITIRSRASIEEVNGHSVITVTEVPYGINTMELKNKVAELVHTKVIDGITDYHTDLKDGIKITITLKKDANPQVVLNNLYKHTSFQITYGIIFLMLDGMTPKTLGLKDIIQKYIEHQREVIVRRCKFDLNKALNRVHILEGLKIALDNIDEVIKIIKSSKTDEIAKAELAKKFGLDSIQSDAILEMKLRRLTGLERDKIENELNDLLKLIDELRAILSSDERVFAIIKEEMLEIKNKYADERRTSIDMTAIDYIDDESLIPEENIVITLTKKGYIKRLPVDTYKIQNRGGVGIKGMAINEEDFVEHIINSTTHNYILFFTNKAKVYRLKGYEIPEFSRQSKGLPIINLLNLEQGEYITSLLKVANDEEHKYLVFATKQGLIKRTEISEFSNIRASGKKFITLRDDDELISVKKTDGSYEILMASSNGRLVRFPESLVRIMGRGATGVRGINLDDGILVGMEVANSDIDVLVVTEKGYGKKTPISEYRVTNRGGKGVKTLSVTDKNGTITSFKAVDKDKDLIIITNEGIIIRLSINSISTMSRVTQGVKLINLRDGQKVSSISVVDSEKDEENLEPVDRDTSASDGINSSDDEFGNK